MTLGQSLDKEQLVLIEFKNNRFATESAIVGPAIKLRCSDYPISAAYVMLLNLLIAGLPAVFQDIRGCHAGSDNFVAAADRVIGCHHYARAKNQYHVDEILAHLEFLRIV
jgi:hypothetical protein